MKMKLNWMWLLAALIFVACDKKVTHQKTPGGMSYQVYEGKGKDRDSIGKGNYIKVHVTQKINDSVAFTSTDKIPVYIMVGEPLPYDISELWTNLREGDSVVAVQMMDTFIKRNPQQVPPEFRNGDRIYTHVKILDVFTSDSLKFADNKKEEDAFAVAEIKMIEKYLADRNIKAEKTPSGVFVETLSPGSGELVKPGQYVSLKYKGTSFSGVEFDSNTAEGSPLLSFTVGAGEMISGFDEGVTHMRPGSKVRIYIPSMLAYKGRPGSPNIKPYESLMFDLELISVADSAPQAPGQPDPH